MSKAITANENSNTISVIDLVLPAGVEMVQKKTCITFYRGEKRAILKGRALEFTNVLKELGTRVKIFSDDQIEKCHLGSVRAIISGIEDNVDLTKILNKYFRSTSKKKAN